MTLAINVEILIVLVDEKKSADICNTWSLAHYPVNDRKQH